MLTVRPFEPRDADAIWFMLEPVLRAGDVYALPADWNRTQALAYWFAAGHEVFVAEDQDDAQARIVGSYYLRVNQQGGGAHVANCGYLTAIAERGRGVARAMCAHSLQRARDRGFRAMQFNFVVSSNERAVRLWQGFGFEIVGRLPDAFRHPQLGDVDALVMFRNL
jgi:ribosomal protein S18 acetylase RimI-like enzyme